MTILIILLAVSLAVNILLLFLLYRSYKMFLEQGFEIGMLRAAMKRSKDNDNKK